MTCAVSCGFDGLWVPLRSSKADMASIPGRGEPDRPEAALALLPTAGVLSVIRHMFPGRSCRVKPDERATRSTWNTQPCGPAAQDTPKAPDERQKPRYAHLVPRTARGCDEQLEEPKARGCASLADGVRGEEARRGAVARGSCPGPVNTPSVDGGAFCCIPTIRSPGRPGHGASSHPILPATSSPLPARSRCKRRHRSRTDSTRPVTQASNAVCQPARRSYSPMSTHGPAARCHQPVERRPDAPTASMKAAARPRTQRTARRGSTSGTRRLSTEESSMGAPGRTRGGSPPPTDQGTPQPHRSAGVGGASTGWDLVAMTSAPTIHDTGPDG